jgi:hypothetical protein
MRRKYRNSGWLTLALTGALVLAGWTCDAQYRTIVTAPVDSVPKTGIYRVVLPPSFVARCRTDLSDLRIFDEAQKEIPYVLRTDLPDPLNAGFQPVPDPKILQKDSSDRHSYYWLQYDDDYRIDRLSLVITGPALFKRTAVVSTVADKWTATPAATINIDPADSVFRLRPMKANRLLIAVDNHDNTPLAIRRVATAQSGIYLLTYLEPGHAYVLMVGDPGVAAPEYDLHYFTDSTQLSPVTIGLGPIERMEIRFESVKRKLSSSHADRKSRQVLLWSLVVSILLFLLYVSVKLARAVNKKESE